MFNTEFLEEFSRRDWHTAEEGTVRYALVGLGWWTVDQAIPAIRDSELCETTVVVSGSHTKAEQVADDHEIDDALTYEAFQDGTAADAYDAVYIATPNALHLPYAETAAALGKAVLCEKPMEATVERAERMVETCEQAGVPLMVGYRMQTEPAIRRGRELLREGYVGEPRLVHGSNSQMLLSMIPNPDQWRLDPDLSGYGTSVMDLGIYPLNTTRFLLDADPVAVQATMDSRHEAFADVPDEVAAFTITFDDGTHAACTASQRAANSSHLRIVGTEGELHYEPAFHMETDVKLSRGDSTTDVHSSDVNQMTECFDYFADRVLTGTDIGPSGEHGLVDMRTIAAIHEASETGRIVELV